MNNATSLLRRLVTIYLVVATPNAVRHGISAASGADPYAEITEALTIVTPAVFDHAVFEGNLALVLVLTTAIFGLGLCFLVSMIGLFFVRRWAARLYLAVLVISFPVDFLVYGAFVTEFWDEAMFTVLYWLQGAILLLCFCPFVTIDWRGKERHSRGIEVPGYGSETVRVTDEPAI